MTKKLSSLGIIRSLFLTTACLAMMATLMGCPSQQVGLSSAPASQQIQSSTAEVSRGVTEVKATAGVVESMTPTNVEVKKPEALGHLNAATQHFDVATTGLAGAEKAAIATEKTVTKQDAKIADLQKPNPFRDWLYRIGIPLFILSLIGLILSYWIPFLANPKIESALVGGIISGLALTATAYFFVAIMWIIGILLLTFIGVGILLIILNRKLILDKIKTKTASTQTLTGVMPVPPVTEGKP